MKNRLLLYILFYRTFALFSVSVSIGLWGLADFALGEQFWRFLPLFILLKVPTYLLIWYYSRRYTSRNMFFYSNKGISETRLFLSAFMLDLTLFFLPISLFALIGQITLLS